jgi:hypothetical protein
MFFAEAQNKLIYAATKKTAAELIIARADAKKPNMALTSWKLQNFAPKIVKILR